MYPRRSSAPINQNSSYPRHTSRMYTLSPPAFGEQHLSNPNGPLHPLYNPSLQMYPGHHIQNQGFLVHPRSVVYNVPLFYPQTSDVNTLVPPSLGQPQNENSYGQLHSLVNPGYQVNPAGYEMQQMQPGFGPQNAATDDAPVHDDGFVNPDDDNMQQLQQAMMDDPLNQSPDQGPKQEVPEQPSAEHEELVVELEQSLFPNSTSRGRLRWTVELQKRFAGAAEELGGYFKATPKKLLERMNVRGLTREQLKSHLQKVRNKMAAMNNLAVAEGSRGPQNQDYNTITGASQFSEGNEVYLDIIDNELYVDNKPNVESANGEGLNWSSEAANNNMFVPAEDLTPGLNLENFNLPGNLPNLQNDNADDGVVALVEEDPLGSSNFQDSALQANTSSPNNNGRALVEDLPNNYTLPEFELIPTDVKEFGIIDWLEDPIGYYLQNVQNCQYYKRNLRNALGENELPDIVFDDSDFSLLK